MKHKQNYLTRNDEILELNQLNMKEVVSCYHEEW